MINFLKSNFFRNVINLYIQQLLNFIFPIILISYLTRLSSPNEWGLIIFIQSTGLLLAGIVEYSFSTSACREIAKNEQNKGKMREIFSGVLSAQLILAALTVIIASICCYLIADFKQNKLLYFLGTLSAIANVIKPLWFFQGIGKLTYYTKINLYGQILYTILVIVIVKSPNDFWYIFLLQFITHSTIFFITTNEAINKISSFPLNFNQAIISLKSGGYQFLNRISTTLYTTGQTFVVGVFLPTSMVAYYGLSEKIIRIAITLYSPISMAIFPKLNALTETSIESSAKQVRIYTIVITSIGLISGLVVFIFASPIISILFGKNYIEASSILQTMSLTLPLIALSNSLGINWLIPLRKDMPLFIIIVTAGIVTLLFDFAFIPIFSIQGAAWGTVIAELWITGGIIYYLEKNKSNPLFFKKYFF